MCMPTLPENIFTDSINELLKVEKEWVPSGENNSLYIRPLMFAVDPYIGIKPADKYIFMIICGLAGGYYSEPVNVKIETNIQELYQVVLGLLKLQLIMLLLYIQQYKLKRKAIIN